MASNYQPDDASQTVYQSWFDDTMEAVSSVIQKQEGDLRNGLFVFFHYPATLGKNKQMWERHHNSVAEMLRNNGWFVSVMIATDGSPSLRIASRVPEPPPPPR